MSIREQIAPLEELARLDGELRRVEGDLQKERVELDALRVELAGLEGRLATDQKTVADMEKTRGDLTGEIRQMNQQIERSREKLGRSRNEKESLAVQRELEELRKLLRDREDDANRVGLGIEDARKSIATAEARRDELVAVLEGRGPDMSLSIDSHEGHRGDLRTRRDELAKTLPAALYRRYENIRQKRPHAIAMTSDGTCQGCYVALAPMFFQKLRRLEEFEQCPNCRRLLYYVMPEAPPPSKEEPKPASTAKPRAKRVSKKAPAPVGSAPDLPPVPAEAIEAAVADEG